jgi:hypothetical protein
VALLYSALAQTRNVLAITVETITPCYIVLSYPFTGSYYSFGTLKERDSIQLNVLLFICYHGIIVVSLSVLYTGYLCMLIRKRIRCGQYRDFPTLPV